jgi:hypothetical protein
MTQVEGTFKVMCWEEKPYDEAEGQPKLTHAEVTYELMGAIQGEASVEYLMGYGTNGIASYVGLARITGKVGERDGTFVVQDIGAFQNGVAKGRWTVLPGLGTGQLREIHGDGHYAATHESATYLLDLSF